MNRSRDNPVDGPAVARADLGVRLRGVFGGELPLGVIGNI
jgi:hypothetical protein